MPVTGELVAGRYRLDRQLAAGGMGAVWLGHDELLRRTVAVKALHLQAGLEPAAREVVVQRAMREARITARLHHAHAVQMFDIVAEPDGPCLIMEYVHSRSLQDVVRTDGPLPIDAAARIGTQIAAALAAAHRAGIVHRDIKPGNILITDDGTAKITDFGISHAFDDVTLTTTGMVTGTPAFLAPEVARGAPSNFASDVYSLGVTLYFAVEGESPFGTDTNAMATLHRVASEPPRPPVRAGALTPLLGEMMAARPEDRPSMVDIANRLPDLHRDASDLSRRPTQRLAPVPPPPPPPTSSPRQPQLPPPPPAPPGQGQGSSRPSAVAVAVAVLAAVLAGVLIAQSGGSGSDPAASRTSATVSQTSTTPTSASASAKLSSEASTTASSTSTPPRDSGGAVTDADLATAVTQYFQLVPDNLDAGWARLTRHFQQTRAGGRSTYDTYWGSIDRVDVADVQGDAPRRASARLTYHYSNGQVVTQQTTFTFVRQGGELKIDGES